MGPVRDIWGWVEEGGGVEEVVGVEDVVVGVEVDEVEVVVVDVDPEPEDTPARKSSTQTLPVSTAPSVRPMTNLR